jgi:hypothetical protein
MLKKNIYILYPPGYCGSYISWAIAKSDRDLEKTTVDNPINSSSSVKFGGQGSAHLYYRNPTHMGWENILIWFLENKPTDKRTYIINAGSDGGTLSRTGPAHIVKMFSHTDPEGIYINIHHNDDLDLRDLGNLNLWTKWPIYFKAIKASHPLLAPELTSDTIDNRSLRNFFVKTYPTYFPGNTKIDQNSIRSYWKERKSWFDVRYAANPHEINPNEFTIRDGENTGVYELGLNQILSGELPDALANILTDAGAGDFNFDYLKSFHQEYVNAQTNLAFLDGIKLLRNKNILSDCLLSNPLVEAITIQTIAKTENLPVGWENMTTEEIHKNRLRRA